MQQPGGFVHSHDLLLENSSLSVNFILCSCINFPIAKTKIFDTSNLKEAKVIFGSWFQSMVGCLQGGNMVVARHSRRVLLTSWQLEAESRGTRARKKGARDQIYSARPTFSYHPPPTSPFTNVPISELAH